MTQNTLYLRVSRRSVRQALSQLPTVARAAGPISDAMMTRTGVVLLGHIRRAFIVKARGGTDESGDRWKPLSPKTVAYSKTRQRGRGGRTKTERGRSTYPSQALSSKQQDRWWEVYRRQLAVYRGDKGHAAAVAWLVLKGEGARTLVDKYGHRQVEILRDTGLLLNSLSPGVTGGNSVFRVGAGEVVVGTNRKGAAAHHRGVPGRLPQRRLWPPPNRWPASWKRDILEQLSRGMSELAIVLLKEAGGP